ncbi:C40 family peptidase [Oceanibium sediminis]|uniref:C40 family peptidase n=1 Tax=Oceanibium sediminis TaxID=2026339 RepID=UPI000DD4880A|nr:NlpC/P60 family protein [Oceanibium sediminis]
MSFDPRITPARPDLAAASLKGRVKAERFVPGEAMQVHAPLLDVFGKPDGSGGLTTQLLFGEWVEVFDSDAATGLSWVQNATDGYVGYVETAGLGPVTDRATHRVATLAAQIYDAPALKSRPRATLPYGARLAGGESAVDCGASFTQTPLGWVPGGQLAPLDAATDFVAEARRFLGAPYLWGGRSAQGLDCSALIQLPLWAAGVDCPRDSDMQEAIGQAVSTPDRPGDIVCWKGHIGIVTAPNRLLHANAHHMAVAEEPLDRAIARIRANGGGEVTAIRRL